MAVSLPNSLALLVSLPPSVEQPPSRPERPTPRGLGAGGHEGERFFESGGGGSEEVSAPPRAEG